MKKIFKQCTSLLLLLALIAAIKPIPNPTTNEPAIQVCSDDEWPTDVIKNENASR